MKKSINNMKKKIAGLTTLLMLFTLVPSTVFAATNSDISGHWAQATIQNWLDQGTIEGYPDRTFRPDNNITRAEFMALVNREFGYTTKAAITYVDVRSNDWYFDEVSIAQAEGYISGYPDGTMKPDSPISREEAATIIMKILKLAPNAEATNIYTDALNLTWSKGAVGAVLKAGIMNGYPIGSFGPQKLIKRGECVVSLDRAMNPNMIAPVLKLIGSNPASTNLVYYETISAVDAYADPGAIAIDNIDGNITDSIIVTGLVDTEKVGSYPLTYTVTDTSGNSTSVIRTVNVVARMNPETIPQFVTPLLIPWAMPKSVDANPTTGTDYYEIAIKQFVQQVLPAGNPGTTVWGYGSLNSADPNTVFHSPSLTIEAKSNVKTRVKWVNGLVDANGNYLPHLFANDQTISSFPMELTGSMPGMPGMPAMPSQGSYVGPVPIVTHLHGAHVIPYSDGHPMSWYMPNSASVADMGYVTTAPLYGEYKAVAESGARWTAGEAVYDYTNDQRANTLWYHDHAMGITRTNVYAGLAGFYLIRGGVGDVVTDRISGLPAVLPGPAPTTKQQYLESIATGNVYEVPIVIQDRTFNTDGSLWYPGSRAEFDAPEGYTGPYAPDTDVAPIWNPEFIGDTIMVNGNTWPTMKVQPKMYRFKFLNGANARTFILGLKDITTPRNNANLSFCQIGTDGGFIAAPTELDQLLMMPAERADVIVDFSKASVGDLINLTNVGPDGPFSGGAPGNGDDEETFEPADPETTGLVMQFKVIASDGRQDLSTPPDQLVLPTIGTLTPTSTTARTLSLNEIMSTELEDPLDPMSSIGPSEALLGTAKVVGGVVTPTPHGFVEANTEIITLNDTETWEIYNFTGDAHPIHLHLVEFQVVNRQEFILDGMGETGTLGEEITQPEAWESGYKDTVIVYPGQVLRIKAKFDMQGRYMWHCHILDHEDNEMMREFMVEYGD